MFEQIDRIIREEFYEDMDRYLYCLSEDENVKAEEEIYIRNNYECEENTVWAEGDCIVILNRNKF